MTSKINKGMGKMDMKHKLKSIMVFTAILVLFSVSIAHAAFFDTAGKSARAIGMGEVFLASSSDASGYWYNPAGLTKFETKQLSIRPMQCAGSHWTCCLYFRVNEFPDQFCYSIR